MLDPIKVNAVYEDLYTIPENMIGEIIDDKLYAMPRPSLKHSKVSSGIGMKIGNPYEYGQGGPGGWVILDEPEIKLGKDKEDIVVPDLAGWRQERLPELPEENWVSVAPDWICEVLSPSTMRHDRKKKMPKYAKSGVKYLWLIDPTTKIVEIFKLVSEQWVILDFFSDDDMLRAEPFQEIEIDLENLWTIPKKYNFKG